ncbi:MAG: TRAFs-binding domain-containing protein [Bacteroidota bacterium]|nr:TRAFs-binding domain-containing protein [Bacteroidota bacterium]
MANGTCFVVMGFGKKTDFETGRTLDLDMSYQNMIKPAVEAAGLTCIRADEIVHSGLIDVPMYEQLLNADVVVADLSTSNRNAFYELGVRHALRPFTTVVICEDGMKPPMPFDVNHVAIRQYHHLGEDIGTSEAKRFSGMLTNAITEIVNKNPRDNDSPVYTFLDGLKAPEIAAAIKDAVEGTPPGTSISATIKPDEKNLKTHSELMQDVDEAQKDGDWLTAKVFLSKIRKNLKAESADKEDSYILQRLALATYKSKSPNEQDALKEAVGLLTLLEPSNSNDPETLGLWGAVHKRLWDLNTVTTDLDEAVRAYERGFYLRNDYYNGINYAFLLNVRAAQSDDKAEAISDFIQARRVRQEVVTICKKWLKDNANNETEVNLLAGRTAGNRYWVEATLGEAYAGLENPSLAEEILTEAYSKASEKWMPESTETQIGKLQALLNKSPLKFIQNNEA